MPRIFDNIEQQPVSALNEALPLSSNADFCVGNRYGCGEIVTYTEPTPK